MLVRFRSPLVRHAAASMLAVLVGLTVLVGPASARAAVLDGDYVNNVLVGTDPSLRSQAIDVYIPAGVLETADGRELWARAPQDHRAMASTTKIMTAVIVLERADLDQIVTVGTVDLRPDESSMGLRKGERVTIRDLLEGMLIASGNDAATALAQAVAGDVPSFVKLMNDKATALDLVNTHYVDPEGLDAPGHYTSAEDLASLARYAMTFPEFRRIVSTPKAIVRSDKYTHVLKSTDMLLGHYDGVEGVKTGNTAQAGYCFVAAVKRGDLELYATIMGAATETGRFQQAQKVLDWGFLHYKPTQIARAGDHLGRIRVSDYIERTVAVETGETTSVPVFDIAGPVQRRVQISAQVAAPVKRGERVGTVTLFQGGQMLAQVPAVASSDIPVPTFGQRVAFFFIRIWNWVIGKK
jgi:D-alanyl-D-alanine carboxypeptidase (penicillin-binding protein 5/6)